MGLTDTHSHLYAEEFDSDRAEALKRAYDAGVGRLILPNIDEASVEPMLRLCQDGLGVCFPMIGLHPTEIPDDYERVLDGFYSRLTAKDSPYVGIGEIGIDLYWETDSWEKQKIVFRHQLNWASELSLPVSIHCRSAHKELVSILSEYKGLTGIFHCFGGTEEEASELLAFDGFVLGIGGVVTFKKSVLPRVLANVVPVDRIVIETDCPYLAPVPYRGKRNESSYIVHTAEKVAEIYGIGRDELERITELNVEKIFPLLKNRNNM